MNYRKRIISDSTIMLGKPVVKGTRITVESILKKLAEGQTVDELLEIFPNLSKKDICAALDYASEALSNEQIIA